VIPPLLFWYWWIGAVILAIAEIVLPGAVFIWLAIAAAATGALVLAIPGMGGEFQLLAFSLLSVLAWVFGRRFVRRHLAASDEPALNRRGEQYVGRRLILAEAVRSGVGRGHIGDSLWTVVAAEDLDAGTEVTVVGVDGIRLKVERTPSSQDHP
jgi:hypothetical protein